MSQQTLRRRLHAEGVSPKQVLEGALLEQALVLLSGPGQSVSAVARALGFAEPSTFSRAFRRWTGHPPARFMSTEAPGLRSGSEQQQ